MKTKYILKGLIATLLVIISFNSCSSDDDKLIEELLVEREFAPIALTAIIRNQTTVELNWTVDDNVDNYVVEISEDASYSVIVETVNVTSNQLPVQILLAGETLYYIRVKALSSRGLEDSKWSEITAQTLTEQIFLPVQPGDVQATEVLLRWVPNSEVTQIVVNPGNITHIITTQEQIDGMATITGLTGETEYTATLFNNSNVRGVRTFTTGIDIGTGILVTPADDLFQMIADAEPGAILVLEPGDYTAQIGVISLNKSITIRGLLSFNKPLLKVSFELSNGATDVNIIDLDLEGDVAGSVTDVIDFETAGDYNSVLIRGCNIHDFDKSLIKGQTSGAIVQSLIIENSVVTNFPTNSADFIDFRSTNVLNISVRTSTFNNCAPARDFFRIDAAGTLNGNATVNVLLEDCTLYACANNNSRRILYVRFNSNEIIVRNNLITDTVVEGFSDQSSTDPNIEFINNNYFNAPTLYTPDPSNPNNFRYDASDTYTTLNPGYVNVASGNFTITNQTLLDNEVGDPRWRQ